MPSLQTRIAINLPYAAKPCRGTVRDNDLFCVPTREQNPKLSNRCSITCDAGKG